MPNVDFFLSPVPKANRAAYEELDRVSEQILREYGAMLNQVPQNVRYPAVTSAGAGCAYRASALSSA
jgi:uncharacterized protein YbaA (DUF1428 family)